MNNPDAVEFKKPIRVKTIGVDPAKGKDKMVYIMLDGNKIIEIEVEAPKILGE